MQIAIAGAGIGGLTAAIALRRAGFDVTVYEQAGALEEVGAGLQLSSNAMRVLDALGVGESLAARASQPEALELRLGRSGRRIFSIRMGEAVAAKFGAPYLHVHRADLVDVLHSAALEAGARVVLDARVIEVVSEAHGVRCGLANGKVGRVDLVVGADGLHSTVREKAIAHDSARFTGCVAWRMTVPMDRIASPPEGRKAIVWAGPGRHAVTYPLRGGTEMNFVGIVETETRRTESWSEAGDVAEVAADFADWAEPVRSIIAGAMRCHRWALFDREPLPTWSRGRVTLLGDACHAMPPFQAQGAAMAIEDAWALANCLKQAEEDIEAAMSAYEKRRQARTRRVMRSARANQGVFHRTSALAQAATYGPMWLADRFLPWIVQGRQDWIYGHDETSV